MEVLNLFSVILDLLAWTALIRLLYCPGLKFDLRFWSYITLIAVIEQIFVYQDKILEAVAIMTVLYPLVLILLIPVEKKICICSEPPLVENDIRVSVQRFADSRECIYSMLAG